MSPQKRYLELLRMSLLNQIYLEHDARMLHTLTCIAEGRPPSAQTLRDIRGCMPELVARLERDREEGRPWWVLEVEQRDGTKKFMNARDACEFTHSMIGAKRMRNIEECLDVVRAEGVPGDLMETGVWRGGATIFMRGYLAAYEMPGRDVWAADSFEGLPPPTHAEDRGFDFSPARAPILAVSLEQVRALFARYNLLDERVHFLKGWFRDTLPGAAVQSIALLRLDGDLYESTMDALTALYDRVSRGGFVLIDDYGDFPPCSKAVDEFRRDRAITAPLVEVDWSGAYWRKS